MLLSVWQKTSGTGINVITVLLGTSLGIMLRHYLPARMQQVIMQAIGLFTLFLGITMASSLLKVKAGFLDGVLLGLIALVAGGLLGEWGQLEQRLNAIGDWLKQKLDHSGRFTEGFVTASLQFCVGPVTLMGCLTNGLTGDPRLLVLKAVMDGLSAIALTSSFGIGVGFSILVIVLYQGSLSLLAGLLAPALPDPANAPTVLLFTGVGGLMIVGLGLKLLELAPIRVAAFLPALGLAPLLYMGLNWIGVN